MKVCVVLQILIYAYAYCRKMLQDISEKKRKKKKEQIVLSLASNTIYLLFGRLG